MQKLLGLTVIVAGFIIECAGARITAVIVLIVGVLVTFKSEGAR